MMTSLVCPNETSRNRGGRALDSRASKQYHAPMLLELRTFKTWFENYCDTFSMPAAEDQRNLVLKREHTHNVCLLSVRIARDLGLSERRTGLAETAALFHDVGRFPQYARFKTFVDSASVNHAALGARVLLESNVLCELPKPEQDIIVKSVALHNVFRIPEGLGDDVLLFLKLVRDADKLDILRVSLEYYRQPEEERASAVGLGLTDAPGYSPDVLAAVTKKEMVRMTALKTITDFKLLQLAWIYDLNYAGSLRILGELEYIDKIGATLPDDAALGRAVQGVKEYVGRQLQTARQPSFSKGS